MVMALVSIVHSITSLPEEFRTAIEIASLHCEQDGRLPPEFELRPLLDDCELAEMKISSSPNLRE
jgi:hypothetical protein